MSSRLLLSAQGEKADHELPAEACAVFPFPGKGHQRAKKLSGGEAARTALARLLMRQYELLIKQGETDPVLSTPAQAETKQFLDFYGI